MISPCDCKHRRTLFIQSSRSSPPPRREYVTVCRDCGEFRVSVYQGGEAVVSTFTLVTDKQVEAAARYVRFIEHLEPAAPLPASAPPPPIVPGAIRQ
jgi:hypothetical protein